MKLVFVPGSGNGKEAWVYQARHFAGSEAVALPGHPEGEPCKSIGDYADWLHGYINGKKFRDVVLVGHSMGGAVALTYGLKYGRELKGLILIGTGARLRVHPDAITTIRRTIGDNAAWQKYVEGTYFFAGAEETRAAVAAKIRIGPAVMLNDSLCCDNFDIISRVHEITVPTFIICGSKDDRTPVKYSQYLAGEIAGAQMAIIDGATHAAPREKPQEVNAAIEGFLTILKRAT